MLPPPAASSLTPPQPAAENSAASPVALIPLPQRQTRTGISHVIDSVRGNLVAQGEHLHVGARVYVRVGTKEVTVAAQAQAGLSGLCTCCTRLGCV